MTLEIVRVKAASSNFATGRNGEKVSVIVVHTEQGSDDGTMNWFANPAAHASAHYSISFEGRIRQFMSEDDTAWHAGNMHVNRTSVGIELEGYLERAHFPQPMIAALVALIKDIATRHNVVLDREHVIGHCEVPDPLHPGKFGGANNHKDPGPAFPWALLCDALGMQRKASDAPSAASVAADPTPTPPAVAETQDTTGPDMACSVCGMFQAVMSYTDPSGLQSELCGGCAKALNVDLV